MNNEARVVAGALVVLACLQVSDLMGSTRKDAPAPQLNALEPQQPVIEPQQTKVTPGETLRPNGDFRELVYERLAHLQAATTEEESCRSAQELGNLFISIDEAERQAIEDEMIAQMIALLDGDTLDGSHKCLSYAIGGILMTLGSRAEAAVPSLERALEAAELARSTTVASDAECAGSLFLPGSLDYVLRQALVNIDGRERGRNYALTCPKDGDPPG